MKKCWVIKIRINLHKLFYQQSLNIHKANPEHFICCTRMICYYLQDMLSTMIGLIKIWKKVKVCMGRWHKQESLLCLKILPEKILPLVFHWVKFYLKVFMCSLFYTMEK